jgi:predicted DCC family thiol-disulfide oxidoreductase YuxK
MRTVKQGLLQNDWLEIAPRIKRGETSADLLARLAEALRPKLRLSKRFSYPDASDEVPEFPWQLMSIDYEVEDDLTAEDVLSAWPKVAAAETDAKLLSGLTGVLSMALDDATDVGVEGNEGYGTSDSDVPSVAMHEQNTHRTGFHAIVRIMADLWERLAAKSPALALPLVEDWCNRPYRLMRRLTLFACVNPVVPPEFAADVLIALPQGELFFTNATVEVFRLIRARWNAFPKAKQDAIFHRLCEGAPRDWFRADADADKYIDRSRFDSLAEMERDGLALGAEAEAVLHDIRARWPEWQLRPPAQAGFHVWHGSGGYIEGDSKKLEGLPDGELVSETKRLAASAAFLDGDNWQALCLSDPDRALRGLDAAASAGDWTPELWQQLLWARKEYAEPGSEQRIAELLLLWQDDSFGKIAPAASSWLTEHAKTLGDAVLWPLWDRIADATLTETQKAPSDA